MKRQTRNHLAIARVARGGIIAALYIALTYLSALLGLSSGPIQFRLSEALCILPIFLPEAIPALTVGCILANLFTGALVWDIIFGSLATLIGALGAYLLRRCRLTWVATLPTLLANAIIVPFVLIYAYMIEGAYIYFLVTVAIGELVCACLLGTILGDTCKKTGFFDKM